MGRVDYRLKAKQISGIVKVVAVEFQKCKRVEAARASDGKAQCVCCKKWKHWQDGDGGHFISRSALATVFHEFNVHFQCKDCNQFDTRNAKALYSIFMVETYTQKVVDELLSMKNVIVNYTKDELFALRHEFRERWKRVMREKRFKDSRFDGTR